MTTVATHEAGSPDLMAAGAALPTWESVASFVSANPIPTAITALVGLVVAVLVYYVKVRPAARKVRAALASRRGAIRGDQFGTIVAAGLATAVTATGMWKFFVDILNMPVVLAGVLFAFIEVAILVEALRSRRFRILLMERRLKLEAELKEAERAAAPNLPDVDFDVMVEIDRIRGELKRRPARDVDGAAVWVLAAMTGMFSALDSTSFGEVLFRLTSPFIAAWLWERGMTSELRSLTGEAKAAASKLGRLWEKLLVKLRIVDPTGLDVDEEDANRRVNKLVRSAFHMHSLPEGSRKRNRKAKALRNAVLDAASRKLLDGDEARLYVRNRLAMLHQVAAATDPAALVALDPWGLNVAAETPSPGESSAVVVEVPEQRPAVAELETPAPSPVAELDQADVVTALHRLHEVDHTDGAPRSDCPWCPNPDRGNQVAPELAELSKADQVRLAVRTLGGDPASEEGVKYAMAAWDWLMKRGVDMNRSYPYDVLRRERAKHTDTNETSDDGREADVIELRAAGA